LDTEIIQNKYLNLFSFFSSISLLFFFFSFSFLFFSFLFFSFLFFSFLFFSFLFFSFLFFSFVLYFILFYFVFYFILYFLFSFHLFSFLSIYFLFPISSYVLYSNRLLRINKKSKSVAVWREKMERRTRARARSITQQ
jgi:hypothetical protein